MQLSCKQEQELTDEELSNLHRWLRAPELDLFRVVVLGSQQQRELERMVGRLEPGSSTTLEQAMLLGRGGLNAIERIEERINAVHQEQEKREKAREKALEEKENGTGREREGHVGAVPRYDASFPRAREDGKHE